MLVARQQSFHFQDPPKVPKGTFLGIGWGGTALAFLFVLGRIYTRLSVHRKLYWDDAFVIFAWLMLLANSIIWQVISDKLYENLYVAAGIMLPPPTFMEDTTGYLRVTIAVIVFFYSGLWAVKAAFLIFFRRLGDQVKGQRVHWWIVAIFTFLTWAATFGTIQYKCLAATFEYLITQCISGPNVVFQRATLFNNMAMDVATDLAIVTIPIHLLWNVRISIRQKLALMGIFSLTVFIMVFAIVRATVVTTYSNEPDQTWLYMWSSIEQTVSILIACLASFRSLFTKQKDPSPKQLRNGIWPWSTEGSGWSLKSIIPRSWKLRSSRRSHATGDSDSISKEQLSQPETSYVPRTPPDGVIQVSRDFSCSSHPRKSSDDSGPKAWDRHVSDASSRV